MKLMVIINHFYSIFICGICDHLKFIHKGSGIHCICFPIKCIPHMIHSCIMQNTKTIFVIIWREGF